MKKIFATGCATVLFWSSLSFASVDTGTIKARIQRAMTHGQSLSSLYAAIHTDYGSLAIKPLIEIADDEKTNDETRWACVFGIAKLAGRDSLGLMRKFMTDKSWMMRDAALKSVAALGARDLSPQIEQRLHDDALIVRTTAVETIGHLHLRDQGPKLLSAMFDPINFHGGKALWIHQHILTVLEDFRYKEGVPRLVQLLDRTNDDKLQKSVITTLEKLTGKSFAKKPLAQQIYLWKRNTLSDLSF